MKFITISKCNICKSIIEGTNCLATEQCQCTGCGKIFQICQSCKARICPSCGAIAVKAWGVMELRIKSFEKEAAPQRRAKS